MRRIVLPVVGTVAAWRREARCLAAADVPPEALIWRIGEEGTGDLFADVAAPPAGTGATDLRLPRIALETVELSLYHSDPERFARGYAVVRALSDGLALWGDRSDPTIRRVLAQAGAVRRDIHKMHAFVRFREVPAIGNHRAFAAWFEPQHPIVEAAAPFFARRFGDMDWVIATPTLTARFLDGRLTFGMTGDVSRPSEDAAEDLWRTYYASIFNPARLMVKAMQSEMPKKYWKNLPEARLIPDLIRDAPRRSAEMQAAKPTVPPARRVRAALDMARRQQDGQHADDDLGGLRRAAARCSRCALHAHATQTVFGEGPANAELMIVGEQPGDMEDLAGRPFVGPAGQVFDDAVRAAGLVRDELYVTNAVKHFKFAPRGKRRLHQRPHTGEIEACRWWLDLERRLVRPKLVIAMGRTACQALTGSGGDLLKRRGEIETTEDGLPVLVSIHPSYVLRQADPESRRSARDLLQSDLAKARDLLELGFRFEA